MVRGHLHYPLSKQERRLAEKIVKSPLTIAFPEYTGEYNNIKLCKLDSMLHDTGVCMHCVCVCVCVWGAGVCAYSQV